MSDPNRRGRAWAPIGVGGFAVLAGALLGGSYPARLADHRGNHLVPVMDAAAGAGFVRPRHPQKARTMMLTGFDVGTARRHVGYESPSHFSCDCSRVYGTPPARDIAQLRQA